MNRSVVVACLGGVAAALSAGLYLNSLEATYRQGAQRVPALVARQYIEQGTMLDASLVEETRVPKQYVQPKALQSVKELAGAGGQRMFMTLLPVEKGEQIVTTKLSPLGMETGISSIVPG